MARKSRKHNSLLLPSRQIVVRGGRLLLLTMLVGIFVMGRSGNPYAVALQARLSDAVAPALAVIATPLDAIKNTTSGLKGWALVHQENEMLRAEKRELMKWQALAKEMQVENEKLRGLLNVAPRRGSQFVTANIVSGHGSSFSSAAIINAGKQEGVAREQAVISERGLIGRVIRAGQHSAQVLLLTDMNSRIPVMNERTREKMILVGKSGSLPSLSYVSTDSGIRKGDRIVTSGDGGVFPKNIAVGIVKDADRSALSVELFANIANIEYVSVVQNDK